MGYGAIGEAPRRPKWAGQRAVCLSLSRALLCTALRSEAVQPPGLTSSTSEPGFAQMLRGCPTVCGVADAPNWRLLGCPSRLVCHSRNRCLARTSAATVSGQQTKVRPSISPAASRRKDTLTYDSMWPPRLGQVGGRPITGFSSLTSAPYQDHSRSS